jgi:hypothetical protein
VVRSGSVLHLRQGEAAANILWLARRFPSKLIAQTERFILANSSTLTGNIIRSMKRIPGFCRILRDPS